MKIEDSSGKQEQALSAAQKLINSEKVVAIIGPTLSNEMMAAGPEANASGVPIMGTSTTAKGLIVATPWFGEKNDPKVKAFVAKYEKAYGKKPDQFAAQAYDAFYIMTNALKAAGKADRAKLFV